MSRRILFVILLFALFSVCVHDSRAKHFKPDSKPGVGPPATYHLKTASRKTRPSQYPQQPSVHERFATFLVGDGFKSTLLLENFRLDVPITVTPALILGAGEVPMDPVVLAPHSTATVDISGFLQAHGYTDKQGTAVVRYTFSSYGPINAAVESTDEAHYLYLNSYAASPEEYWSGTAFDAVVWTPQEGTQGFISITNTSTGPRAVRTTFLVNGHLEEHSIEVAPRHTSILPIDDLVARSQKTGAGIHVEFDKYPGDILVEGQLFNKQTGFVKHIHFLDKALQLPTGVLRTHFMLFGSQPAEDSYPPNVSFYSVAVVRNIDSLPVKVTPTVKSLQNGSLQTINLQPLTLGVGESRLIDFSAEQKAGYLPQDFYQGSLELTPDTGKTSIVGELFNFGGEYGGYVVGPSFSAYPSHGTASIWRTDGTFQTTIMIENTAAQEDQVSLNLSSGQNAYNKIYSVPAGGLLKINLRDLQQKGVPDKDGKLLLGTSGVVSITSTHNTPNKLSIDKIIHSANESDYVGLPPTPCDYVVGVNIFLDMSGGENPYPIMQDWIFSQSLDQVVPSLGTETTTPSLVTINGGPNGDLASININSTTSGQTMFFYTPPVGTTTCDACSSGDVYPQGSQAVPTPTVTLGALSQSPILVGNTATVQVTIKPSATVNLSLSTGTGAATFDGPGGGTMKTISATTTVTIYGSKASTRDADITLTSSYGQSLAFPVTSGACTLSGEFDTGSGKHKCPGTVTISSNYTISQNCVACKFQCIQIIKDSSFTPDINGCSARQGIVTGSLIGSETTSATGTFSASDCATHLIQFVTQVTNAQGVVQPPNTGGQIGLECLYNSIGYPCP